MNIWWIYEILQEIIRQIRLARKVERVALRVESREFMRIRREESEERKRRERNAQVSKRGFCRMYLGGDQMIVYASEKERCCSTNKDIARERERHGDAQTRLHLHRLAPTVESEIPIAAIAVTNIPRVGGTKVFVACVWLYKRTRVPM